MDSLPLFPDFRKFTLEDRFWYNEFYGQFEPYADFFIGNLIIWLDFAEDLQISNLNGNAVFQFTNILEGMQKTVTMIGNQAVDDSLTQLLNDFDVSELTFLPKVVIDSIKTPPRFSITEERQSFDYILSTERLGLAEGPEMRKMRRMISYWNREVAKTVSTENHQMTHEHATRIKQYIDTWEKTFTHSGNDPDLIEAKILPRSLHYGPTIPSSCFYFLVDGIVEGVILYQTPPQQKYVILNHIKTTYSEKYIFDMILHHFALFLHERGVEYINFEQDLDIPGLREHKLSLKPVAMLEKYQVSLST